MIIINGIDIQLIESYLAKLFLWPFFLLIFLIVQNAKINFEANLPKADTFYAMWDFYLSEFITQ